MKNLVNSFLFVAIFMILSKNHNLLVSSNFFSVMKPISVSTDFKSFTKNFKLSNYVIFSRTKEIVNEIAACPGPPVVGLVGGSSICKKYEQHS